MTTMHVLGLTGGICAGKSTIAQILSERGVPVLDADKLGHEAYRQGTTCYAQLIHTFGTDIVQEDGNINRRVLGGIVFGDEVKMTELKQIVWPEIRRLLLQRLEALRSEGKCSLVVVVAAVMIEAQWQDIVDTLWVVYTSPETAVTRLMARNNLSAEEAQSRLKAQLSNEERLRYAQESIRNDTDQSIEALEEQVLALLAKIQK